MFELEDRGCSASTFSGTSSGNCFRPCKVLVQGFILSPADGRFAVVKQLLESAEDTRIKGLTDSIVSPKDLGQLVLIECGESMVASVLQWWKTVPRNSKEVS